MTTSNPTDHPETVVDITPLLAWARSAFPYSGPPLSGNAPRDLANLSRSAFNVASAYASLEKDLEDEDGRYRLGTGLNGFGTELRGKNDVEGASNAYRAAYAILTSVHTRGSEPQHFGKAIKYAYANLRALGIDPSDGAQTLTEPDEPYLRVDALLVGAIATGDGEALGIDDAAGLGEFVIGRESLRSLAVRLVALAPPSERVPISEASAGLRSYLDFHLSKSGILSRDLSGLMSSDEKELADILPDGIPQDRLYLVDSCRQLRAFAYQAGDDDVERRRRWLLAATLNHLLWRLPQSGLETNEPQVQIDLMGYVSAILMDHRYNDGDRDLLLDCGECIVRIARSMKPVVFWRFEFLRDWVLSSVGTYLVLAGPSPSTPADSYYDERLHAPGTSSDRGLQRAKRDAWPRMLLARWNGDLELADGACYALASVSGWDSTRATWLLEVIYKGAAEGDKLAADFWHDRLPELMGRADRVRIVANPWDVRDVSASRGSMISSDAAGRFVIPNTVLRAAAAQAVTPGEFITVHGQPFAGRRVPTYLLTNRFGPFAILKIDYREKIQREVVRFQRYARRLHQSHRPSDCTAHRMDMYLGESGSPLRAIETSYVFEERDKPLTLGSWLKTAEAPMAVKAIHDFLLHSLRPWLAHVRRDRIDLRSEYPVLRPAPAPNKQFPDNWANTELGRLETAIAKDLGLAVDRKERQCGWVEELDGGKAAIASMEMVDLANPLWLAAEIAELGTGELVWIFDSFQSSVRDFDTLLSLCHGDLHLDNVLCTSVNHGMPRTVLIDFESAHEGHVCKDLARLESSVLTQGFDWPGDCVDDVSRWFCSSVRLGQAILHQKPVTGKPMVQTATTICSDLREVAAGCGQGHWPIQDDEYLLALFGNLLPMARYSTLSVRQRRLAFLLATIAGSALLGRWQSSKGA